MGAFVVIGANNQYVKRLVVSSVTFKRLDEQEIDNYLASGEWNGKAGGYAIQGRGGAFIKKYRVRILMWWACLFMRFTML